MTAVLDSLQARLTVIAILALVPAIAVAVVLCVGEPAGGHVGALALVGGAAAAGLGIAWLGTQLIVLRPIRRLLDVTARLGAGDLSARAGPPYEAGDIGALARACDAMAETLAAREQRLRESEERFRDFTAASADWCWEQDEHLRFTHASDDVYAKSGVQPAQHMGKTRRDVVKLGVSDEQWRQHDADLAARRPFRDFRFQRGDPSGELRHFSVSGKPLFDAGGRFRGYRGVARDITDEVRTSERVLTAQNRLLDLFESMPDALALFDGEGRLGPFNARYRDLFAGLGDALAAGASLEQLDLAIARSGMFGAAAADAEAWAARRRESRRDLPSSQEQALADGCWLHVREYRTRDGGILAAWTDITDAKGREQRLREALRQIEQASRAKSEFLANMSHELRTPLNAIIGFSEMMKAELYGPVGHGRYQEYASDIHASGHHLLGVINDILEFSKFEAGRMTLQDEPVDVLAVIEASVRLLRERAAIGGVAVAMQLRTDLPYLRGEAFRLKQILLNLLTNAIKFTPADGEVRIGADLDAAGAMVLTVSDTGVGMAPADIPKALEAFGQVDSSWSRRYTGTGLGLPLTKALVELHDGTLAIDSAPMVGTAVTIRFPPERVIARRPALAG